MGASRRALARRVRCRCWQSTTVARRPSAGGAPGAEPLAPLQSKAMQFSREPGGRRQRLYSNPGRRSPHTEAFGAAGDADAGPGGAHSREAGRRRAAVGRVDAAIAVWQQGIDYHKRDLRNSKVPSETARSAALEHKASAETSIQHHKQGINLIKDCPPRSPSCGPLEEAAGSTCRGATTARHLASEKGALGEAALGEVGDREPRAWKLRKGLRPDRP